MRWQQPAAGRAGRRRRAYGLLVKDDGSFIAAADSFTTLTSSSAPQLRLLQRKYALLDGGRAGPARGWTLANQRMTPPRAQRSTTAGTCDFELWAPQQGQRLIRALLAPRHLISCSNHAKSGADEPGATTHALKMYEVTARYANAPPARMKRVESATCSLAGNGAWREQKSRERNQYIAERARLTRQRRCGQSGWVRTRFTPWYPVGNAPFSTKPFRSSCAAAGGRAKRRPRATRRQLHKPRLTAARAAQRSTAPCLCPLSRLLLLPAVHDPLFEILFSLREELHAVQLEVDVRIRCRRRERAIAAGASHARAQARAHARRKPSAVADDESACRSSWAGRPGAPTGALRPNTSHRAFVPRAVQGRGAPSGPVYTAESGTPGGGSSRSVSA